MTISEKQEAVTLEPCPFCGGEANADGRTTYSKSHEAWWADGSQVLEAFFVSCVKCGGTRRGIVGGQQTREAAINAWNTRTPKQTEPLADEVERVANAMWQCEGFPDPLSNASEESQERLKHMARAAIKAMKGEQ